MTMLIGGKYDGRDSSWVPEEYLNSEAGKAAIAAGQAAAPAPASDPAPDPASTPAPALAPAPPPADEGDSKPTIEPLTVPPSLHRRRSR